MHDIGRLALPLFVLAFGDGLGPKRPSIRLLAKLVGVGVLAQGIWFWIDGRLTPNVVLGLALTASLLLAWHWNRPFAVLAGLTLGFCVEGTYSTILMATGASALHKPPRWTALAVLGAGIAINSALNQSLIPLLAAVIFFVLRNSTIGPTMRWPRLFYGFYPLHLLLLGVLSR